MLLKMLKCKLHRATVTAADLHYEGSIAICPGLTAAAGLRAHESVDIYNVNTGARFTTYVIPGETGQICVNGAAARLAQPGDLVIIVAYALLTEAEADHHQPTVVMVDAANRVSEVHDNSGRPPG
ncbi:MAG TPA: aspartate 1-decarboxylase [Gammaproteobacteria bacterium]|nr:aspartate 1-decarboxylase [Gammaproteobacteria bacterium]